MMRGRVLRRGSGLLLIALLASALLMFSVSTPVDARVVEGVKMFTVEVYRCSLAGSDADSSGWSDVESFMKKYPINVYKGGYAEAHFESDKLKETQYYYDFQGRYDSSKGTLTGVIDFKESGPTLLPQDHLYISTFKGKLSGKFGTWKAWDDFEGTVTGLQHSWNESMENGAVRNDETHDISAKLVGQGEPELTGYAKLQSEAAKWIVDNTVGQVFGDKILSDPKYDEDSGISLLGNVSWENLTADERIKDGTGVKTLANGSASISTVTKGNTLILKPDTRMEFEGLGKDEQDSEIYKLNLSHGWVKAEPSKNAPEADVNSNDPLKNPFHWTHTWMQWELAQMLVRPKGTVFVCGENGRASTVKVLEGTVTVTGKSGGKAVDLDKGEMIEAVNGKLAVKKTFNVSVEEASWKAVEDKLASSGGSTVLIIVICVVAVVVIAGAVLLVLLLRRRRKGKNPLMPGVMPAASSPAPAVVPPVSAMTPPEEAAPQPSPGVRQRYCENCGRPLRPGKEICRYCGPKETWDK